jgi:transposase
MKRTSFAKEVGRSGVDDLIYKGYTVDEIAKIYGVSPGYLRSELRRLYGEDWRRYILEKMLARGFRLDSIALSIGVSFCSLTRYMKNYYGKGWQTTVSSLRTCAA